MPEVPVLTAIIGALAVAFGAWLTWVASGSSRLQQRVDKLEERIDVMWEVREDDAITKRRMGDFIDLLEHHIWQQLPPPPPERPDGI